MLRYARSLWRVSVPPSPAPVLLSPCILLCDIEHRSNGRQLTASLCHTEHHLALGGIGYYGYGVGYIGHDDEYIRIPIPLQQSSSNRVGCIKRCEDVHTVWELLLQQLECVWEFLEVRLHLQC